ncbi:MAG: SUMF1/EgtB/PvdO family nonheme iron enzyme, partial [Candidatus Cloacimonetes bacterium]|nr:SUMF1/EgtB/PvdO family nonheme iron enzyme [Candidatus Cloacimonadota bacterium]
ALFYCYVLSEIFENYEGIDQLINIEDWSVSLTGGNGYRLPTEVEWECIASNGNELLYPWGNETPDLLKANFDSTGLDSTNIVGSYSDGKTESGLTDFSGNVAEWVIDCYFDTTSPDNINPLRLDKGRDKVTKGGSWMSNAEEIKIYSRDRANPADTHYNIGFRIIRIKKIK